MDQAIVERIDPAAVQRELAEAIERTESLGLAIEAHLDDIERELEDIRRTEAQIRYPGHPSPRPELVEGR